MYKTSEWVSLGHPDKMADFISCYILDRYLEQDPMTRYALEVMIKDNIVTLGGEITSWNTAYINRILNNYTYIGMVHYDGEVFPGEHEAIIDEKTWNLVQKFIKANDPGWDRSKRRASDAALHGIIRCGHCNCAMTPIQSKRWGKVYRYYRCAKDANRDVPICPVKEVSAGDIEKLVCEQIDPILKSPEVIAGVAQETGLRPKTITSLLGEGFWEELTPLEKQRLMQILLEHVVINEDGIIIEIRTESIKSIQEVYLEQDS